MICDPNCPDNWVISRAEYAALERALFSHAPAPQTAERIDVPEAQFRGTEQPTASEGLGEDVDE